MPVYMTLHLVPRAQPITASDLGTTAMNKVLSLILERLETCRLRNDHAMGEIERNILIGRIQELKALRELLTAPQEGAGLPPYGTSQ